MYNQLRTTLSRLPSAIQIERHVLFALSLITNGPRLSDDASTQSKGFDFREMTCSCTFLNRSMSDLCLLGSNSYFVSFSKPDIVGRKRSFTLKCSFRSCKTSAGCINESIHPLIEIPRSVHLNQPLEPFRISLSSLVERSLAVCECEVKSDHITCHPESTNA